MGRRDRLQLCHDSGKKRSCHDWLLRRIRIVVTGYDGCYDNPDAIFSADVVTNGVCSDSPQSGRVVTLLRQSGCIEVVNWHLIVNLHIHCYFHDFKLLQRAHRANCRQVLAVKSRVDGIPKSGSRNRDIPTILIPKMAIFYDFGIPEQSRSRSRNRESRTWSRPIFGIFSEILKLKKIILMVPHYDFSSK